MKRPRPASPKATRGPSSTVLVAAAVVCVVVVAVGPSSPVRAAGSAETFGLDARSSAKAGATLADETGPAAPFVNPAALTRTKTPTVMASFQLSHPQVDVTLATPPTDPLLLPSKPMPVPGLGLGLALPVRLLVDDRLFVGVSAFVPTQVVARARAFDPVRPSFFVFEAATEHVEFFAAAALRILDEISLGVGARFTGRQEGSTTVDIDPVRGRFVRAETDTRQTMVPSPLVGLLLGPFGGPDVRARFALVAREASAFEVELPAAFLVSGVDVDVLMSIESQLNYSPRMYNGGFSLDLGRTLNASFDVQYAQWSQTPPPFLQVATRADGEGLQRLGLGGAFDAPAPGENRVTAPGFVDTLNVRAGFEATLWEGLVSFRGGYGWRPSPVPDQTSGTNIVDNSTHTLAVGGGVAGLLPELADKPWTLLTSYQAIVLQPRSTEKASARDPVGSWRSSGVLHHVNLELRYAW